jgi:3-oxoacyl-[acyl-carrier protein] reductase
MGRLTGKVAIVTGASTGCGPVMARLFVAEGARVLLAARREDLVREAAAAAGGGAIGMRADVTSEADVAAMVERAMDAFGQVDILLNNAAAPGTDKPVWEQTLDNWNATIGVVLTGAMLCTREVLNRSMLARRSGSIMRGLPAGAEA